MNGIFRARTSLSLTLATLAISLSLAAYGAPQKQSKQPNSQATDKQPAEKQTPAKAPKEKAQNAKSAHSKASNSHSMSGKGDAHIVLHAMRKELDRSFSKLKNAGNAPLYFLAYRIYDTETLDIKGTFGGLLGTNRPQKTRVVDIDLRVGSPERDSSHPVRGGGFDIGSMFSGSGSMFKFTPMEDNEDALRVALWALTDTEFKSAQKKYMMVLANKDVKVEEEDNSADFSLETPQKEFKMSESLNVDKKAWEDRIRRLSKIYRSYPGIEDANVEFTATKTTRYLVTSEGTEIQDERIQYRVFTTAKTVAADGMRLALYDGVEAPTLVDVPDEAHLEKMVSDVAKDLVALRTAPVAEPYVGPAILKAKASGVFFHETFGHRIEGHRQKSEDEGRTFAKKVGQQIMPEFVTVSDDPTRVRFGAKALNGHYKYDDEGVLGTKVTLVDKGVLKTFLMGRSPIKDFTTSNGHGRCSPGRDPVARQANLIIDSAKRVPYPKLREMLIEEVKKQGKPYGLIFDEIAGGFTMTQSVLPQVYKLLPLRVWKVFPDGKPDQLMRGADLVGTPLASLERIMCGADDDDTFNGTCGAESGWVPVSATSPSLLVGTIEVERQHKAQDKPPLLPSPMSEPDQNSKAESSEKGTAK
ncbi:MAG: peptidase U62 [Candidatus Melainabacteria bacterium]|nr:MAG: peptidase U62 [Candidatus Melainabacteria bacterium]